jgi:hypothetical protein
VKSCLHPSQTRATIITQEIKSFLLNHQDNKILKIAVSEIGASLRPDNAYCFFLALESEVISV